MYIVLDSNKLHGRTNPETSGIKFLLGLIAKADAKPCLPEPVITELIQGIADNVVEALRQYREKCKDLKNFAGTDLQFPLVEAVGLIDAYKMRLNAFIEKHEIITLPFPFQVPSHEKLFQLASQKLPPFDPKGNQYRDAIIGYCILEFASTVGGDVVFLTEEGSVPERFASFGDGKFRCMNEESVIKELNSHLGEAARKKREWISQQISENLSLRKAEVEKMISDNAVFPIAERPGETILSIDGFSVEKIHNVQLMEEEDGPSEFFYLASVEGRLTYQKDIEPSAWEARYRALTQLSTHGHIKPQKVGETRIDPGLNVWDVGSLTSMPIPSRVWTQMLTVRMNGRATVSGETVTKVTLEKVESPEHYYPGSNFRIVYP